MIFASPLVGIIQLPLLIICWGRDSGAIIRWLVEHEGIGALLPRGSQEGLGAIGRHPRGKSKQGIPEF